jgi:hypothetical protein
MLQQDSVVMMVVNVLKKKMMIPVKPRLMTVIMAMISPLREGISLADFCLPESFLSLCIFHPAEAAESICDPHSRLRFPRGRYTRRGVGTGGPGWPHHLVARPGLARARGCCGPLVAHLALSFWLLPSCGKIGTSGYFPRIVDLQKYYILTVIFPAES